MDLDVNVPLKKGKKIRLGKGDPVLVTFKYERLHIFCFICGKLDHTESLSEKLFEANGAELEKNWGPFLKAPDRRDRTLSGDRWLRTEW